MNCNSQACQDLFVISVLKGKKNGQFVEIGSNHPIIHNNSYLLEKHYNWSGILVEYDKSFLQDYKNIRQKSIPIIDDARNVKYRELLDSNNFNKEIDYLQIDLDVDNKSTIDVLLKFDETVFDKYKFATITFEHDIYRGNYFDTQEKSREIFKKRGYELVFPNVSVWVDEYKSFCPFEDWYVHPDIVDLHYINSIKTNESYPCIEIKEILLNTNY